MNQKNQYSLIAIVAISIASVGIFSITTSDTVETYDDNLVKAYDEGSYTIVHNLYFTTDLVEQLEYSQDVVKGEIVSKTSILQYRGVGGEFLNADAKNIAETEPYIVYEIVPESIVRTTNDNPKDNYTFKVLGGEMNGAHILIDTPEFNVGDNVVVILTEAFDGTHQELVSGTFSIYKLENGKAIGGEDNLTEQQLLDRLSYQ